MRPARARVWITAATIVSILTAGSAHAQRPAQGPVDATQVLSSISRGVSYLKSQQGPRGNWSEFAGYPGGVTALCTLALLNAGVEVDDPAMRKALAYLRGQEFDRTYTVALQTMVLCAAEPKKDLVLIGRNVRWLEDHQVKEPGRKGCWWYYTTNGGDNSNSQFAVLALYEAQRVGVEVNHETWVLAHDYWRRTQNVDGSWGYTPGQAGDGSMTCAGISGLAITTAALESGDATIEGDQVMCCRPHEPDQQLERAIAWLAERFSVSRNPHPANVGQNVIYYYLYGLERAGRLTARRFIGDHDWYREGAEFLVQEQDGLSHFWKHSWHAEANPHISTALALLFLSKGRRPIVMAKLKYGAGEDWNQHRRDAANLSAYTEEKWKLGLTWQIMDPAKASVEDLLQAPVLYISGSRLPQLTEHAKKLRDYVDRGGFLFAEACCSDQKSFDLGFRKLMALVFPEPEYQLQRIPPGHPLWRMEEMVRPESPYTGQLWGVDYGCRTCVVYSETDLSCYWELAQPGVWSHFPKPVTEHIADALAIGINVLTYATNREPKGKEQSFVTPLADDAANTKSSRGVIEIAKLRHGGGCNDAPGALVNLLRTASQGELQLRVRTSPELINISDPSLFNYHLAFMHGRQDFRLTPAERTKLREYLQRGGTLLSDAICGSEAFVKAFRRELAEVLPGQTLARIPANDPMFATGFGGYDIRQVSLRDPQPAAADGPVAIRTRPSEPQLEGIQIDGRWVVVFSPYDISCALESREAVGCRGYTREDAARIGLNVLLYSLNQ